MPATTICNPSADDCDPAESCNGTSVACPADVNPTECNEFTSTEFCALPAGSCGGVDGQFRQLFLQDPVGTDMNNYRLNATNPGQFYDNIFVDGVPGDTKTLNIEIPYPFVTQGAVPIQVHDGYAINSSGCFVPSPSLPGCTISTEGGSVSANGSPVIVLGDYEPQAVGSTTTATVSCTVPPSGLLYVTIHLDDGLKRTTNWDRDLYEPGLDDAIHATYGTIRQCQPYAFSVAGDLTDGTTVYSSNEFKRNPGVNGLTLRSGSGNPVANVGVELWGPTGKRILTATTDQDGFYMLSYKHTGKQANYTVKVPAFGLSQVVPLKANGYAIVLFENMP
jgi:hypothetical protein